MLDVETVGQCVRAGLAAAAVLLAIRFVLRPTIVELFRQRIFALRRELFMRRVEGEIEPTEPSYQQLMRTLNGVLRFAESITFGRLLVTFAFQRNAPDALDRALESSPLAVAALVRRYRSKLGYEIVRHVIYMSPLSWGFLLVIVPTFHILAAIQSTRDSLWRFVERVASRPAVRRVESEAREMLPDEFMRAA